MSQRQLLKKKPSIHVSKAEAPPVDLHKLAAWPDSHPSTISTRRDPPPTSTHSASRQVQPHPLKPSKNQESPSCVERGHHPHGQDQKKHRPQKHCPHQCPNEYHKQAANDHPHQHPYAHPHQHPYGHPQQHPADHPQQHPHQRLHRQHSQYHSRSEVNPIDASQHRTLKQSQQSLCMLSSQITFDPKIHRSHSQLELREAKSHRKPSIKPTSSHEQSQASLPASSLLSDSELASQKDCCVKSARTFKKKPRQPVQLSTPTHKKQRTCPHQDASPGERSFRNEFPFEDEQQFKREQFSSSKTPKKNTIQRSQSSCWDPIELRELALFYKNDIRLRPVNLSYLQQTRDGHVNVVLLGQHQNEQFRSIHPRLLLQTCQRGTCILSHSIDSYFVDSPSTPKLVWAVTLLKGASCTLGISSEESLLLSYQELINRPETTCVRFHEHQHPSLYRQGNASPIVTGQQLFLAKQTIIALVIDVKEMQLQWFISQGLKHSRLERIPIEEHLPSRRFPSKYYIFIASFAPDNLFYFPDINALPQKFVDTMVPPSFKTP